MGGLEVQPLLLLCWHPTDLRITLIKHSSLLWCQTKHSPAEPGCGLDSGYIQYGYNWLHWLECHCYFLLFTRFVVFSCSLCCLTYRLQAMLFKGSLSGCPVPPNGESGSVSGVTSCSCNRNTQQEQRLHWTNGESKVGAKCEALLKNLDSDTKRPGICEWQNSPSFFLVLSSKSRFIFHLTHVYFCISVSAEK